MIGQIGRAAVLVLLPICCSTGLMAQNGAGTTPRVTHVLGFENIPNNATGDLSLQAHALRFQKNEGPGAQINVDSIQGLFLGVEDKQVGGTAMAIGRAATPYGGGRVIGLFSHKKFDTLTAEYVDPNGGFHGAIFQLIKGQGQALKDQLVAEGAHVTNLQNTPETALPLTLAASQPRPLAQTWSLQVDKVNPGDVEIEPAFRVAIYENLLDEFAKTKQFKQVFRSGDRNAAGSNVLILKTTVQKYTPGSETRRAVTTVSGATKLNVRSQLCTPDGKVVVERVVDGNVRFFGGNLRATHNLARNVAEAMKKADLPEATLSSVER
jgi:hypothetical protein